MFWKRWFKPSGADDSAYLLYRTLVTQARAPQFYLNAGVPDTLDGRFDMIVMHMFLLIDRLTAAGAEAEDLSQRLFDVMFDDMDQALREMGVGDLSVGKKVKTMARAFYGRLAAYDKGFRAEDEDALKEAIKRNVFAELEVSDGQLQALARYMRDGRASLGACTTDDLRAGEAVFPAAPEMVQAAEARP